MIAKKLAAVKKNFQKHYDLYVGSLDLTKKQCSCMAAGCFVIHGYYLRYIKVAFLLYDITIVRVKCKSCGKTHAILPSWIVPHSQILLEDMIEMITAYEEGTVYKINNNYKITRKDVNYIIKKYKRHWKDRLLAIADGPVTEFLRSPGLIQKVYSFYKSAFLQIKRSSYLLFS